MLTKHPKQIGHFEIIEPLGQGGMGIVYRGLHQSSGEQVAVKTVLLPHEGILQNIRREIRALARIKHPGIVRIIDEGIHDGLPWYAMELLEGKTLRQFFMDEDHLSTSHVDHPTLSAGTRRKDSQTENDTTKVVRRPLSIKTTGQKGAIRDQNKIVDESQRAVRRNLALQVITAMISSICTPLAFLHGEGIVHRDLKPENIFIRENGTPVLVDFGLMAQFSAKVSREALMVERFGGGTVSYMAPEQIRGEFVDARADLYALGCILYELLVGHPPFVGIQRQQIAYAHLYQKPVAPSCFRPEIPSDLDDLILHLLAKAPHDRLGYADRVVSLLGGISGQMTCPGAGPKPRAYLYRPCFSGREKPLTMLLESVDNLKETRGGIIFIAGESGVGKTRLVMELGKKAVDKDVFVLTGDCPKTGALPLQGWRKPLQVIGDHCRERGREETDRLFGKRGKVLSQYESSLQGLQGQDAFPEVVELPPDAARERLFGYLVDTLKELASSELLLLIIDDLQWADELTIGFIHFAQQIGCFERSKILIVGTFRTEEMSPDLKKVVDFPPATVITIEQLSDQALSAMVGEMLALATPPRLLSRFLARQFGGNPFVVAEYLRGAVDQKLIWRDNDGRWQLAEASDEQDTEKDYTSLSLPGSVRELITLRLENLPETIIDIAKAAAIVGYEVNLTLLIEMTNSDESTVLTAVEELFLRRILDKIKTDLFKFPYDKIREVIYESIAPEECERLHFKAARGMEVSSTEGEINQAVLGYHWEKAGESNRARACYLLAARKAKTQHSLKEAERLYRHYQSLLVESTPESIAALKEFCHTVLHMLGRNEEALTLLEKLSQEAQKIGDLNGNMQILYTTAMIYSRTDNTEEPPVLLQQAMDLALQNNDLHFQATVICAQANYRYDLGRLDEAAGLYDQAMTIARDGHFRQLQGDIAGNQAIIAHDQGRVDEALEKYHYALALHREFLNRVDEGNVLHNMGALKHEFGDPEKAEELYEQALSLARDIGFRRLEGNTLGSLASVLHQRGELDRVRELFDQALIIHTEIGNRRFEAITLFNLASCNHEEGDIDTARQLYQSSLTLSRKIKYKLLEGLIQSAYAALKRQMTCFQEASDMLLRAEVILEEMQDIYYLSMVYCEMGFLELAHQRTASHLIDKAEKLQNRLGISSDTICAKKLASLRRAQKALKHGKKHDLFRGELRKDVHPAILKRYENNSS
ncbi:tetratricopeptide repeat protein [candidate division CSSED10-310 bacterium]|uniref:Tetratricopeptide repeat protein n=1 Tax=candidate division CSSED10-310 bacterium TaxID=2855610 RepID=A0ABV6Z0G8_UNCC1